MQTGRSAGSGKGGGWKGGDGRTGVGQRAGQETIDRGGCFSESVVVIVASVYW